MNKTKVKIVLQGSEESFEAYEERLNKILDGITDADMNPVVIPSASSSGRMCCVINIPKKEGLTELINDQESEIKRLKEEKEKEFQRGFEHKNELLEEKIKSLEDQLNRLPF